MRMGELQATVEFSVELYKFYNVDLFQRGYYQIRTYLKVSPKLPVKIEVSLPQNPRTELVFPACVVNGSAVSKTFQILYRNEEVSLDDVTLFKVHIIVDSHKIEETIERADFQLVVELWFTDQSFGPDQHSSIQCVSSRTLNLHFTCSKGLHHHLPVLFDYFHLSAVAVTIHASLVAVHQPYINTSKPTRPGGWLLNSPRVNNKLQSASIENVLFGSSSKSGLSSVRLSHARQVHREICSVLLSAYENLQNQLQEYMKLLPPWQQLKIETTDCYSRLHNLSGSAKSVDSEDDLIAIANSDIAQLCAENIILWQQFLEVFTLKDRIRQHLAREHHLQRVKRFAEGFFVVEHPSHALLSCSDAGYQNYQTIADATRKSRYFSMLPSLPVECVEMDGSVDMLPIIFEDQYQTSRQLTKTGRHSDPGVNVSEINVNLKRTYRTDRHHSLQSTGQLVFNDVSIPGQNRFPSIDTTPTSVNDTTNTLQPEKIKESRSLNADMNAAFATMSSPVASWLLDTRNDTEREDEARRDKGSLPTERTRSNLKLDLRDLQTVDETSDLPLSVSGAVSPRSIKNILRNKLGKVNIFKGNGTGQMVIQSGVNTGSPSINSSNESVILMSYKKLEQSVSLPHNLTAHLSLPRQISTLVHYRESNMNDTSKFHNAKSMPNFPTNIDMNNISGANTNSESMPDLGSNASPARCTIIRDDILSWPSTSLMGNSTDVTAEQNDIELNNQSLEEFPPLSVEYIDSVISEATSTLAEAMSLRDQPGSSSATTCNSDLQSDFSVEELALIEDRRRSSSLESQKMAKKNILLPSSNGSMHIYEEIHLPPEEFRDPPLNIGKKTQTSKEKRISTSSSRRSSDGRTDVSDHSTRRSSCESQTNIKLPAVFPWDNHRRGVASVAESNDVKPCPCTRQEYIADVLKSINRDGVRSSYLDAECTLFEMLTECNDYDGEGVENEQQNSSVIPPLPVRKCSKGKAPVCSPEEFFNWEDVDNKNKQKLNLSAENPVSFVKAKEEFKRQLPISAILYSDFPTLASTIPYFHVSEDFRIAYSSGLHLIICVHGLDGNSADLRLVKTYLELGLPGSNLDFLMSEHNQGDTFSDFETMTDKLISEIISHIEMYSMNPSKISFIGHSLGNIIIRSALARPEMKPWLGRLHTFLSLSGPHLGTLYNNSGLVNMGMWFMQKWKKSGSLLQLSMKDSPNMRQTFLYKLSQRPGLQYFKNVLLFGSSQDRYVPIHSARIELCKAALKDITIQGSAYREMVHNLLEPALNKLDITFIRYDVHHALPNTPNSIIGRAAHIAVLDSELFIEKFLTVCGLKYFR